MKIFNIPFGDTIMTRMHKTRIRSLLAIGLLAAILASQISTAQTTPPPEGTVNSPDSVLHGRTTVVANSILRQLPSIPSYNQVTNLNQLSGITSLSGLTAGSVSSLRPNDFDGLANLQTLNLFGNHELTSLPLGVFNGLTNLKTLYIGAIEDLTTLPAGIFTNLVNLEYLDLSGDDPPPVGFLAFGGI